MVRRSHALTILAVAGAALATPRTPLAAQVRPGPPDWARRYFASESPGDHFAHAWLGKARGIARLRNGWAYDLAAGTPGAKLDLHGTFKVPVVLAAWSDRAPAYGPASYQQLFFGATAPNGYSLAQFYREASLGRFTFAGTAMPWVKLPNTRAYYMQGFPADTRGRFADYVHDALVKADSFVDWTQYDNDGPDGVPNSGDDDGYVDLVIIVHPGADGVCRTDSLAGPVATGYRAEGLSSRFNGQPFVTHSTGHDGRHILIDDFVVTAGLDCDGRSLPTINIPAHETGHALGLPDLYDRDFSSQGVGVWDVMGYGLYAATGRPALFGAWSRGQLGWTSQAAPAQGWNTLPAAESTGAALRIDVPGSREYFLVENRQRTGADAGLPGSGLVIWHMDQDSLDRYAPSYTAADNDAHPGIAVVRAGGAGADADADPYPGTSGNTAFDLASSPAASLFDGPFAGFALDSLGTARPGGLGVFFRNGYPLAVADVSAAEDAVTADLLRPLSRLTRAQELSLDALGNRNGIFDIGDVVAWLERQGSGNQVLAKPIVSVQHIRR